MTESTRVNSGPPVDTAARTLSLDKSERIRDIAERIRSAANDIHKTRDPAWYWKFARAAPVALALAAAAFIVMQSAINAKAYDLLPGLAAVLFLAAPLVTWFLGLVESKDAESTRLLREAEQAAVRALAVPGEETLLELASAYAVLHREFGWSAADLSTHFRLVLEETEVVNRPREDPPQSKAGVPASGPVNKET